MMVGVVKISDFILNYGLNNWARPTCLVRLQTYRVDQFPLKVGQPIIAVLTAEC